MLPSPDSPIIQHDIAIMTWRNLIVALWHDTVTLSGVAELTNVYRRMVEHYPSGFASCVIVADGVGLPEDACRRGIATTMTEIAPHVLGMCGVQEAKGFRGAAIRSVITALVMMSRAPYKTATVATTDEACEWLAKVMRPEVSASQIRQAMAQFRQIVEARRPQRAHSP